MVKLIKKMKVIKVGVDFIKVYEINEVIVVLK